MSNSSNFTIAPWRVIEETTTLTKARLAIAKDFTVKLDTSKMKKLAISNDSLLEYGFEIKKDIENGTVYKVTFLTTFYIPQNAAPNSLIIKGKFPIKNINVICETVNDGLIWQNGKLNTSSKIRFVKLQPKLINSDSDSDFNLALKPQEGNNTLSLTFFLDSQSIAPSTLNSWKLSLEADGNPIDVVEPLARLVLVDNKLNTPSTLAKILNIDRIGLYDVKSIYDGKDMFFKNITVQAGYEFKFRGKYIDDNETSITVFSVGDSSNEANKSESYNSYYIHSFEIK